MLSHFLRPPDDMTRFLKDLQKLLCLKISSYLFNLPDVSDSISHFMAYKFSKDINTCIFVGQLCLVQIYSTYNYLIHTRLVLGWPLKSQGSEKGLKRSRKSQEI